MIRKIIVWLLVSRARWEQYYGQLKYDPGTRRKGIALSKGLQAAFGDRRELVKRNRLWLLTGPPGCGKTSVVSKLIGLLQSGGIKVGGVLTREVRSRGMRTGFEILDLSTGRRGTLASVAIPVGPRMGKYRVNLSDLARVGASAVKAAVEDSDVIVCDEIGPMELFSPEFRRALAEALGSPKPMVAVVHYRSKDPLVVEAKSSPGCTIIEVTADNRDELAPELAEWVLRGMGSAGHT